MATGKRMPMAEIIKQAQRYECRVKVVVRVEGLNKQLVLAEGQWFEDRVLDVLGRYYLRGAEVEWQGEEHDTMLVIVR